MVSRIIDPNHSAIAPLLFPTQRFGKSGSTPGDRIIKDLFFTLINRRKLEIKVTQNGSVTLLEVLKGDKPVNAQNQVTRQELLPCLQELEVSGGELCFVSGMPMWAITGVALKVKNLYGAVAIYDPRIEGSGGCVVVHSTNPKYEVGQLLPLA